MPLPQVTPNTTLTEFQRQLRQACPWVDGRFVECVFTSGGGVDLTFAHGLGRPWRGAWIVANTKPATVTARTGDPSTGVPDEVSVSIGSPSDVTITVWCF